MGCISSKTHKKNKITPVGAPNAKACAPITKVKEAWGTTRTEDTPWPIVETPVALFVKPHNNSDMKLQPVAQCQKLNVFKEDSGTGSLADTSEQVVKDSPSYSGSESAPVRLDNMSKLNACPSSGFPPNQQQQWRLDMILNDDDDGVSITERPSSRGGMAFDICFDGRSSSASREMSIKLKYKVAQKAPTLTKDDLCAKLNAVEQRRKALEEERCDKIRLKREHGRAVMNALEAFQKAEIAKSRAQLNIKMATSQHNRETYLSEVKNRCKEKHNKMKEAVAAKKVKPLRPPPWPDKQQSN